MEFVRRNLLVIVFIVLALVSLAAFTWAEWHYFIDQAHSHHEKPQGFWSSAHLHDWLYNAAANWQSEALVGVVLVTVLMRAEGKHGKDEA